MFIRYTVSLSNDRLDDANLKDGKQSEPVGIFAAAYILKDQKRLAAEQQQELESRLLWFQRYVRTSPIDELSNIEQLAICWYKPTALEALGQTRDLALFMESHGFIIRVCQSEKPGIILHEDEFQVAAIPARDVLHGLSLRIRLWWRRNIPTSS